MKAFCISLCLVFSVSCSTLKESLTFGAITGGTVGAIGGVALSPDSYSKAPNAALWGSLGALAGAAIGYYLFKEDPENKDLPSMILPEPKRKSIDEVENHVIVPKISRKYQIEKGPIPENLKDKVPSPFLIEHKIPERTEKLEDGRTLTIDEHTAWEVTYE